MDLSLNNPLHQHLTFASKTMNSIWLSSSRVEVTDRQKQASSMSQSVSVTEVTKEITYQSLSSGQIFGFVRRGCHLNDSCKFSRHPKNEDQRMKSLSLIR